MLHNYTYWNSTIDPFGTYNKETLYIHEDRLKRAINLITTQNN